MSIYDDKPWLNHYDDGVDPEVTVSADTSYADLFNASVKSNPAAPAMYFMGVSFSYGELDDLTGRFAAYLTASGVAKGDVVVVNKKYGIRLTEVISPVERLEKLG